MYDPSELSVDPILGNFSVGYRTMPNTAKKKLSPGMGLYQVLHMPDHAPDKSKPWAVVNLQTGDVNGRWHPSKEEAQGQARALYANLGDKAKVHGEKVLNAFYMFADAATLVSDDGVKWIEAIAPKVYSTPAYGDVEITPDKIENFIRSVNTNVRGQEVAINYEHGIDPSKGLKAAGWIKKARKNDRGNLELAVDLTETAKEEVRKGEWKYFSLEWDDQWQHPDGIFLQDVVMGGALTNRPVAKGLMPINFSEIFSVKEKESKAFDEYGDDVDVVPENLPDSAFLFIDSEGGRHLPYKDAAGCVEEDDTLQSIVDFLTTQNAGSDWPGFSDEIRQMALRTALALLQDDDDDDDNTDGTYFAEKHFAVWPTSYVDGLPDSAFLYVEPGGKKDASGKTVPRSLRHLPHKDSSGKIDLPHLRDAIGRIPQMTGISQTLKDTLQTKAKKLLAANGGEKSYSEEKELEHSQPGTKAPRYDGSGYDDKDRVNGWRRNTPPYDVPPEVGALYDPIENGEVMIRFSEQEAVGYISGAIPALRRIHTNYTDNLIEKIERLLTVDRRTRSFNELQSLANEVKRVLRGNKAKDDNVNTVVSEGGSTVGELTDRDLRELRSILEVDDDARIVDGVRTKFGELAALRDAVSASEQERIFAEQYPQFYEQHMKLMDRDRKNNAKAFSESVQKVKKAEGFGLKTTAQGLSTAAIEKIEETHMKFSENRATVDDFEECLRAIVNGGIVQFGELGTNSGDDIPEIDMSGPVGVANARKLFGEQINKYMRDNNWGSERYMEAVNEVSKKHPDLAEAYKVTLPA